VGRRAAAVFLLAAAAATAGEPLRYTVEPGDSLSLILERHADEVRTAVGPRSVRALLRGSPKAAETILHAGDTIVIEPSGRIRIEKARGAKVDAPWISRGALRVSADGLSARVGRRALKAGPGVKLFERNGVLHAVRLDPPAFDVAVAVPMPPNPYVKLTPGGTVLPLDQPDDPRPFVERGELNVHEDHLHLTQKYPYPAWRQLYAAREDDSPYEPVRRNGAKMVILRLLDVHIDATADHFALALAHVNRLLDRAWRGFQDGWPARQIADALDRDFEVVGAGSEVLVGEARFIAAGGLRFERCSGAAHFHVAGPEEYPFAVPIEVPQEGLFRFPSSLFYDVQGNLITPRPHTTLWAKMIEEGQIEQRLGHWHITTGYPSKELKRLRDYHERATDERMRDAAKGALLDVLALGLAPRSEKDLRRLLVTFDGATRKRRVALEQRARREGWSLALMP
jgi:hypothetical protein